MIRQSKRDSSDRGREPDLAMNKGLVIRQSKRDSSDRGREPDLPVNKGHHTELRCTAQFGYSCTEPVLSVLELARFGCGISTSLVCWIKAGNWIRVRIGLSDYSCELAVCTL